MDTIEKHHYLLRLEFLGFRYSGWQQQPGVKTIEGMLRKTIRFVLPKKSVKLLGAGRTDALVSAEDFAVQMIVKGEELQDLSMLAKTLNENLPPDIRLLSFKSVSPEFNAIRDAGQKTYRYYFCFGEKPHPYAAPFFGYFRGQLNLEDMSKTATLFIGEHNLKSFIAGSAESGTYLRTIEKCQIRENLDFTAVFFPAVSYFLEVSGKGFGRYQIRMMMGALAAVGRGELGPSDIKVALSDPDSLQLKNLAPASGLQLRSVEFNKSSV
ncbi:tRNA pseudouridine synthase A [Robiginitalea sp. IMCC44478]|uniref:tRNA pseudouridine synthase A n=1 Tax=Robiginitalea sp. IMCC44478 TaxID=3459122 RepID=UPI004043354A